MLISPPFLPLRGTNETEEQWLDRAMSGSINGHIPHHGDKTIVGSYPVSLELGWHGGLHLVAPGDTTVRAIADGEVIFVRKPKDMPTDQDGYDKDPLNYGAPEGGRCWTSDGVVVIRHATEIGATAQGQATSVTYYSVYMHLHSLPSAIAAVATTKKNLAIYRKDEIGSAGYIYGQPDRIHFEIFCDDENLELLIGRKSGDLPTDKDGRSSAVFGELYFHLPTGTQVFAEKPLPNNPVAHRQPPAP
jgi:hydroxyethylthiazole kinase